MDRFKTLIEKLNGLKIIQKQMDWAECIPEDIWKEHFEKNYKSLKDGLSVDQRRHYETSISVIEIYQTPMGIRHITNIYSESSMVEDCFVTLEFFEMKEVTEISYERV